jgi:hypothetical protein
VGNYLGRRRTSWPELEKLTTRFSEVLLGIRAPVAASTNWPPIVECDLWNTSQLLKFCDPNKGGTCQYRKRDKDFRIVGSKTYDSVSGAFIF